VSNTNGQPSGVAFEPNNGRMYIADLAHAAVLMRKDGGQLQLVVKEYEGVPLKVCVHAAVATVHAASRLLSCYCS
jgi:hypothetical protein